MSQKLSLRLHKHPRTLGSEVDALSLMQTLFMLAVAGELRFDHPGAIPALELKADHWPESADLAHHGLYTTVAVALGRDFDIMRAHAKERWRVGNLVVIIEGDFDLAYSRFSSVHPTVKQIHVSKKLIHEGVIPVPDQK